MKEATFENRDIILVSRGIERGLHFDLTRSIEKNQKHSSCTLFLTTFGGDADAGYRIGRCLQHHYEHISVVIPSLCKSAGTLVAIAAHELVIGDLGELGPLDVQVRKVNEFMERSSGLDFMEAMEASRDHVMDSFRTAILEIKSGTRISTKLAGEFAAQIAASIAAPLYAQIDPNRVGEMQRAINIAIGYGGRLAKKSNSLKPDALMRLVSEYPSHGFVIDRAEAKQELFTNVRPPNRHELDLIKDRWNLFAEEDSFGPVFMALTEKETPNEPSAERKDKPTIVKQKSAGAGPRSHATTSKKSGRNRKDA